MSEPSVSVESETSHTVTIRCGGRFFSESENYVRLHPHVWQAAYDGRLTLSSVGNPDSSADYAFLGTLVEEPPGSHNWTLQVPVDESLEAEARAIHRAFCAVRPTLAWDLMTEEFRDGYRNAARAARAVREGK